MAENPLLPHRKLQQLRSLMLSLRASDSHAARAQSTEAIRAAILLHLEDGDYASTPAATLTPPKRTASRSALKQPAIERPSQQRIAIAAGVAHGFQLHKTRHVALVLASTTDAAKTESAWQSTLLWAMAADLPLIVLLTESGKTSSKPSRTSLALSWPEAERMAVRHGLPVVTVDAEDAVALYRVMQESMVHARTGIGPVLIWCLTPSTALRSSQTPVKRLEAYMRVRKIPLTR